jgi:hypothetical protein
MELVGQILLQVLNTARINLGGAGTQAAALAFGGNSNYLQQQQKNGQEQGSPLTVTITAS